MRERAFSAPPTSEGPIVFEKFKFGHFFVSQREKSGHSTLFICVYVPLQKREKKLTFLREWLKKAAF